MTEDPPFCELCGQPMLPGEEMFRYHGYSGPCPEPEVSPHEHWPGPARRDWCDFGKALTSSDLKETQ
jgi:hypothetical protein